uniref:Uncharacterized protein n=1 Tax=Grammatophora oceanica TaxID=210454 RepID=A0A6U5Q213_9STRA
MKSFNLLQLTLVSSVGAAIWGDDNSHNANDNHRQLFEVSVCRNEELNILHNCPESEVESTPGCCSAAEIDELKAWLAESVERHAQELLNDFQLALDGSLSDEMRNNHAATRRLEESIATRARSSSSALRARSLYQEWWFYIGSGSYKCGTACDSENYDADHYRRGLLHTIVRKLNILSSVNLGGLLGAFEDRMSIGLTEDVRWHLGMKLTSGNTSCMVDDVDDVPDIDALFKLRLLQ